MDPELILCHHVTTEVHSILEYAEGGGGGGAPTLSGSLSVGTAPGTSNPWESRIRSGLCLWGRGWGAVLGCCNGGIISLSSDAFWSSLVVGVVGRGRGGSTCTDSCVRSVSLGKITGEREARFVERDCGLLEGAGLVGSAAVGPLREVLAWELGVISCIWDSLCMYT